MATTLWPIRLCYWIFDAAFQFEFNSFFSSFFCAMEKLTLINMITIYNSWKFCIAAIFQLVPVQFWCINYYSFFHNSKLTSLWHEHSLKYTFSSPQQQQKQQQFMGFRERASSDISDSFFYHVHSKMLSLKLEIDWKGPVFSFIFEAFSLTTSDTVYGSPFCDDDELCQLN